MIAIPVRTTDLCNSICILRRLLSNTIILSNFVFYNALVQTNDPHLCK